MPRFERKAGTVYFAHSGDAGDLIYALPAMRAKAGRQKVGIILTRRTKVRRPWDPEWVCNARSLLELQPYVSHVHYLEGTDQRTRLWDHDVDPFRPYLIKSYRWGATIADYVSIILGVSDQSSHQPWLEVDEPSFVPGRSVIFARSSRYHNRNFPWKRVYEAYRGKSVFVGTQTEHAVFQGTYGKLPLAVTPTLLDVARLIAGSKLFIGNQSVPYAIAEGLKHRTVQEPSTKIPDCMWARPNATFGWRATVPLPEII